MIERRDHDEDEDKTMGLYPSKTELFLPSETLLRCSPDRCWCGKGGHHRDSRYVYVERGGDGRERYHDGFDMMSQLMNGGGGGGGGSGGWPAWKDPSQWNVRDMERFSEFFGEWQSREMGRRARMYGGGGAGGPGGYYGGGGVGRGEFDRMQAEMEERFRRLNEEYSRGNEERDAFLFGSERERRKEQFQGNILRMIQEMWPQLTQMAGAGAGVGAMGNMGMGMGMGMGMPNMPPGGGINMMQPPPPYPGFGMPMAGGNMGGGGGNFMNGMNGMNPMGSMPQMPMQNNMMDPGGPPRFPYRRRRNFAHGDDFDEDIHLANPYPNMAGPQNWRRRRFGDDGDLGGPGGASPMPRRPSGDGPPGPRPGGLDGDGFAYDDPRGGDYAVPPYRPHDPFQHRRQTYRQESGILRSDPVNPPTSPRIATPILDPLDPTSPILNPAPEVHISQTTTTATTHPFPEAGPRSNMTIPPTGIVVEETITADPEVGPSTRPIPGARIFGVHIRATPVNPLRPGGLHRPPPYPAGAEDLDGRGGMPRREVRFADQERSKRLGRHGRVREEDLEEGMGRGDI